MNAWMNILLFANAMFAIIFFIWHFCGGQKEAWMAFFFLILPVMGVVIYYLPGLLARVSGFGQYDRDSLIRRLDIEKSEEKPQIEQELNIIPIEDAMAAGTNLEKRTLLLEQLKKDIHKNYRMVLSAAEDEDSESAHYVAAAKMEAYRYQQEKIKQQGDEFAKKPENGEAFLKMLELLSEYIGSGLPEEKEGGIYMKRYCSIVEGADEEMREQLMPGGWANYIFYLFRQKQYEKAENEYNRIPYQKKTEEVFMVMLTMYYTMKNKQKFYQCLEDLKSSPVRLTGEGLKLLRYWEEKKERYVS